MQYHLVLTERCNKHCIYCGGTRHIEGLPLEVSYDLEDLVAFLSQDPEAVIGFYGGEPLLALELMYEVLDRVPAKAFTLQTNATRLHQVEDRYLHRLHTILASIDGPREVTDINRGPGTYDTVLENVAQVEDRGYKGDVVARMAFSRYGDIYRDVTHLLGLKRPRFPHVHWQLDVFWSELDSWTDLEGWLQRYEEGVTRLVAIWGESLRKGAPLGIVPFIPVFKTLLTGEETPHVRCGAGSTSFAIMTDGSIHVCPVAPELPYSRVGHITTTTPQELRNILPVGPPCTTCSERGVCGGRCLFANQNMFWGRKWFNRVCQTTRHMIHELRRLVPLAERLIEEGVLDPHAFDYPEINNGCEIIP